MKRSHVIGALTAAFLPVTLGIIAAAPAHADSLTTCDYGKHTVALGGGRYVTAYGLCEITENGVNERAGNGTDTAVEGSLNTGAQVWVICQELEDSQTHTANPYWDLVVPQGTQKLVFVNDQYVSTAAPAPDKNITGRC